MAGDGYYQTQGLTIRAWQRRTSSLVRFALSAPDTVEIGGAICYNVAVLTATKLFSLNGDEIHLQGDVADWIKAYRNLIDQADPKERDFYLKMWAHDWRSKKENAAEMATPRKPSD